MTTQPHGRTPAPTAEPTPPEPQNPPHPPSLSDPKDQPKPAGGLSPAQVAGGALAAMTAAFLGSRLSVAGTVLGAAFASVIAAVGGSVYTSSLRRTHDRVRQVWRGRLGSTPTTVVAQPDWSDSAVAAPAQPDVPVLDPAAPEGLHGARPVGSAEPDRGVSGGARPRVSWKAVVGGSVLVFAIAAVALTGFELATGHALSGGQGTTVGRVADGGGAAVPTSPSPSPTATGSTASPSQTSGATAPSTPEPSSTASPSATAPVTSPSPTTTEPTSTTSATSAPSATSSGSAPEAPSGSVAPSGGAG